MHISSLAVKMSRTRSGRKYCLSGSNTYPKGFSHVGGLKEQIDVLRDMILFPLMYDDIFERFAVKPPRGVLFYGPPGRNFLNM